MWRRRGARTGFVAAVATLTTTTTTTTGLVVAPRPVPRFSVATFRHARPGLAVSTFPLSPSHGLEFRVRCRASAASGAAENDNPSDAPLIDAMPPSLARFGFARSSGPGGQNVNKVNTKAELRLDLADAVDSGWLSEDVVARLRKAEAGRITRDGEIVVTAQDSRSQLQNREACVTKLGTMLEAARYPPKERKKRAGPTEAEKARKKENKKRKSQLKQNRRGKIEW